MKCTIFVLCKLVVIYVINHNVYIHPMTKEITLVFLKIIKVGFLLETSFLLDYPQKLQ